MKSKTLNQGKNESRTSAYIEKWDTEKTLKHLIKRPDPLIFDVGANNGSSVNDFKAWWPASNIHCFEPQEECRQDLLETAALYEGTGSVKINNVAVGNSPTEQATFYTHDINSGISGFNKINMESKDSINLHNMSLSKESAKQAYEETLNHDRKVEIIRLDDYVNALDPNLNIDFLKIDTQGFEPEVFDGLGDKLSNVNVVLTELLFFDFYERSLSFSDIEVYLLKAGFSLYDISHISKNPMNGRTDWVDIIYVHERVLR